MDPHSSEFIGEAQESVEIFSRHLLELEAQARGGAVDPEALNAAFRAIHSLKGLAGLFNATEIGTVAHALEGALDRLRLGKLEFSRGVLDVLFEAVETFAGLLIPRDEGDEAPDLLPLLGRIEGLSRAVQGGGDEDDLEWVGEAILSVLSEYEEHRLRENLRKGREPVSASMCQVRHPGDRRRDRAGEGQDEGVYGEVITYLPSADVLGGRSDRARHHPRLALEQLRGAWRAALAERRRVRPPPRLPRRRQLHHHARCRIRRPPRPRPPRRAAPSPHHPRRPAPHPRPPPSAATPSPHRRPVAAKTPPPPAAASRRPCPSASRGGERGAGRGSTGEGDAEPAQPQPDGPRRPPPPRCPDEPGRRARPRPKQPRRRARGGCASSTAAPISLARALRSRSAT
jgi:two-component system chemotaxis sensor kinase CheA